jgi:hypothetical protein
VFSNGVTFVVNFVKIGWNFIGGINRDARTQAAWYHKLKMNWMSSWESFLCLTLIGWLFSIFRLFSWKKEWTSPAALINFKFFAGCLQAIELSRVTLKLRISQSVSPSVLASSPSVTLDQILAEVRQLRGWCHGASSPDGRTGLSSLPDPLLESSSLDPLWSLLYSTLYWSLHHLTLSGVSFARPLLESLSLDPLWGLLYSILYWSLHHLTPSGVSFARPLTGIFITWPSLGSPLLDPLLESSIDPLWGFLYSTLYWILHDLTLSGVSFARQSTGVF